MSIWRFRQIRNIDQTIDNQVTLGEGNTPLELYKSGEDRLFVKRDDMNPTGSWKDRGTAYKLSILLKSGINEVVIPSSGNAAISLLTYANTVNDFKVHVVVSPNIAEEKQEKIESLLKNRHELHFDTKAKKRAAKISSDLSIPVLRAPMDTEILKGYWSLGLELVPTIKKSELPVTVISPVSSGTTLIGLAQGIQLGLDNELKIPKIVIAQTNSCFPMVKLHDETVQVKEDKKSLADAIVDQSALRGPQVMKLLGETNGLAFAITNAELEEAKEFSNQHGIKDLSYTSLLSFAAYKCASKLVSEPGTYILIASGR